METGWIQVFVLVLSECVAPAGKTVCQEREMELAFASEADCDTALEEMLALKADADNVIVDRDRSRCVASARERQVYASAEDIREETGAGTAWRAPTAEEASPPPSRIAHQKRLEELATCEETGGVAPCKVGEIIVEDADAKPVEVWKRDE